ncbi:DUF3667 domain-containing protein [uncultured Psychroserpens sp.]|uniref:DUF3667 domain-containing protein n=1 Tax=uncultured Psychroserpens sp. TaxID=255436 RepID=UPI0026165919|nr:DUF3667 domain-containing protein [uncultured Psychroserpens sp.]
MNCKNCHTELQDNSDFCNSCGGKVIRNRLTFKNLFEHISETFFNYDNKLLRTFVDLFKKPELVIGGYIDGVRKRYVNPISYFGLALTFTGLYLLILKKFYPEALDFSNYVMKGQEEFQRRNVTFIQEYMSIFMMLYVPLYAFIARISFMGLKKFNYTELMVVLIYWQAQTSIITSVIIIIVAMLGITQGMISFIFLPLMILYGAYVFKRLYNLSIGQIVLRTFLFLGVLASTMIIITIIIVIIMFLTGDLQELIEAQRAAVEAAKQ